MKSRITASLLAFVFSINSVLASDWERMVAHKDDLSTMDIVSIKLDVMNEKRTGISFSNSEGEGVTYLDILLLDNIFKEDMVQMNLRIRIDDNDIIPGIAMSYNGILKSVLPYMSRIGNQFRNGSNVAIQILDIEDNPIQTIRHDLSGFDTHSEGFEFLDFNMQR